MNIARLALDSIERFGEYTSTYFEGKSYTNCERMLYSERLATLLHGRGIRPGDRVAVVMPNGPDVTASFHAIWRIGAVIVPVTPQLLAREVSYILAHSGAKAVLTSASLAERVREARAEAPDCRRLLVFGETASAGDDSVDREIDAAEPVRTVHPVAADDPALLIYTSGTTDRPKGVVQSHRNLLVCAQAVAPMSALPFKTMTMQVLPLSHVFGVLCMNLGAIYGCCGVILAQFETRAVLEAIERFRVQRFSAVPTMLSYMLNFPDRRRYDCSSLHLVSSGGAALPEQVRLQFEREFGCRIKDGYGCSEATCCISSYRDNEPHRAGSVGRPIAGVELIVVDEDDRSLPAGQEGELCVRGRQMMRGYWKDRAATDEALRDGWLHTGDIGRVDAEGYLFITGRKKDVVIKGGENIAPRSIEEALYDHPAVAEAAVVGVPDSTFGEELWAVVALRAGAAVSEADLQNHVARYVSRFKVPARIVFRRELPKSSVGKILKRELRRELTGESVKTVVEADASL
ncbi:MAG: class I adenylate-forming enzyme family protein [Planctomycetaceae bacterium]